MDELEYWEAKELVGQMNLADKNLWEAMRCNMYVMAQVNSKKQLKPQDIMSLPFDNLYKDTDISNEDIDRLRMKAKMMQKNIQG